MRRFLASLMLVCAVPAAGQEPLPRQAPLGSLGGIGKVVVVSSHEELQVSQLQLQLQQKLARHGVFPAWSPGSQPAELIIRIDRNEDSSNSAPCVHYTYLLTLELREPLVLEREPNVAVFGVVWQSKSWSSRFGADVPADSIANLAHDLVNTFLGIYLSQLEGSGPGSMQSPARE